MNFAEFQKGLQAMSVVAGVQSWTGTSCQLVEALLAFPEAMVRIYMGNCRDDMYIYTYIYISYM